MYLCIYFGVVDLLPFNLDAHCGFVLYVIYVVLEIEKFYDGIAVGDPRNIRILFSQQLLFSVL